MDIPFNLVERQCDNFPATLLPNNAIRAMTSAVIITLCVLLLLAYVFDITSARTRIPSVILLLMLGWVVRELTLLFNIAIPDLSPVLPVLGTVGLILIVLEGSLELELNKSRIPLIIKSFLGALVPLMVLSFLMAFALQHFTGASLKNSVTCAIPLAVIGSSIAISSVRNLSPLNREFVVYESSLSDILGVLFFNFVALNESITTVTYGKFGLQLAGMVLLSLACVLGLSFLLSRVRHHVMFAPIILFVILIYAISKEYQLPALVFILILGLFLGNIDVLRRFRWVERLRPGKLNKEVGRFKEITYEATFLIRSLFFLLFGYLISTKDLLNLESLAWSVVIVSVIYLVRLIQLILSRLPLVPLLFIAPRGLITILLFLAIIPEQSIPLVNESLILQVIVLTALIMMIGLLMGEKKQGVPAAAEVPDPAEVTWSSSHEQDVADGD